MSRVGAPTVFVGNDFILPKQKTTAQKPIVEVVKPARIAARPVFSAPVPALAMPALSFAPAARTNRAASLNVAALPRALFELFHRYTISAFAILLLVVGSSGISVAGNYQSARVTDSVTAQAAMRAKAPGITGLNASIPASQMEDNIRSITNQSATLTVGDQTEAISPDTIKSWLQIKQSPDKSINYIHVSSATIAKSLIELANKHAKAPVNQVTATHPDGSSLVLVGGKNGAKLTDPANLNAQATGIAKTLMDSKGFKAGTALETVPFAAVTPGAFGKLLEVNVSTKQMWAWENGVVTRTFLISAGAPKTPTPIGQYKIFSKLPVQDMRGYNADGTRYFQPHVRWVNYFLPGGYAVHGNYWRPANAFGTTNTSHGCVSLPDTEAKWVYDFAPIGTTVITHN